MEKESHLEKKSFLRKKWEEFFLFIARKRIAKICNEKNEVLIIKDKFELKEILKEKKMPSKLNEDEIVDKKTDKFSQILKRITGKNNTKPFPDINDIQN